MMTKNSKIQWTDHTYNPWRGCTKVSDGCKHCYAETLSKRNPAVLGVWGPQGTRVRGADSYLRQPLTWNVRQWEECLACGWRGPKSDTHDFCPECGGDGEDLQPTRQRVFCASLADVFEDRPELVEWRWSLWDLISETPNLDWLLLTKRPENVMSMIPWRWHGSEWSDLLGPGGDWPANVWIGTSVENQQTADERIPHLLNIPAAVRFLSMEPLLGPVDFRKVPGFNRYDLDLRGWWVIVGGESGPNARPMHPNWARSIRNQCQAAGVPFFFKQWGEWAPVCAGTPMPLGGTKSITAQLGQKWGGLRADGKMLGLEDTVDQASAWVWKAGKHAAGRLLDGRTWDEVPNL